MSIKKTTTILLAAVMFMLSTGCEKKGDPSSDKGSSSAAESSQSDLSSKGDEQDSSAPAQVEQGEKIKAAAKFFDNEKYEYVFKVTGTGADATVTLKKDNGVCFQTTDYGFCKSVIYCKGADTFRYDDLTKAFVMEVGNITTNPTGNIITETVKKKLPPTSTHIDADDAKKYDVEEYTYTGGTYITVLDYYFDRTTGILSKYTVTYSVEGKDDEIETRQILRMNGSDPGDMTFSENELRNSYTDFSALSESEREKFCKELLQKNGIRDEELYSAGLSPFDLKKISYSDFSAFVISAAAKQKEKK